MEFADSQAPPARARAGSTVLALLAGPLTVPILEAHNGKPLRLPDLRERIGGAAQTTLRGQVGNLRGIGALERQVLKGMPYTVENELTACGREILAVAEVVEAWLAQAPAGSIRLGSEAAKGSIRALIGGWDSTMLRALATGPRSLTELSGLIAEVSYPALERRLSAMRAVRQVEPKPNGGQGAKPYTVTEWTRQAVAPLAAAGRCECNHLADETEPLSRIDVETAFLLAAPLADLELTRSGSCLLAVDSSGTDASPGGDRIAGVHIEVEEGAVTSRISYPEQKPDTWALGTADSWVEAILEGHTGGLRLGGEQPRLAESLIAAMHSSLSSAYAS